MQNNYTIDFYVGQQDASSLSAQIIVPLLLDMFPSRSVVDVGCGVGGWLREFAKAGVDDHLGIDGDYVPRELLKIPVERFVSMDLRILSDVGRRFDMACCFEVAEHLPHSCSEQFVSALAKAAPVVVFSAAIPGQGGTEHINEQWPSYWAEIFARRGYVAVDCVRPKIFEREEVVYWYRQNIIVFCEPSYVPAGATIATTRYEFDRVHPRHLAELQAGPKSGREAVKAILNNLKVVGRAIASRARV
jgi:SAM-dependent methyltransferase